MTQPAQKKYQAYTDATQTVAKTKQIVMLYDGAIRFIQQGKEAIREKRIEDRYNLLTKATTIMSSLQACLDFEKGGDIAKILFAFYSGVDNRLFSVHRTNSIETCDEVIADLKQMRDAWEEVDRKHAASNAATAVPPAPTPDDPDQNVTLSA